MLKYAASKLWEEKFDKCRKIGYEENFEICFQSLVTCCNHRGLRDIPNTLRKLFSNLFNLTIFCHKVIEVSKD